MAQAPAAQENAFASLKAHICQAVEQFEDAMKLNMKLGPHSEAHKAAVRRRAAAAARERERIPA